MMGWTPSWEDPETVRSDDVMENNSKTPGGGGIIFYHGRSRSGPDTNRGVGIQQHEEDNSDVNVMWPRWGDPTRLYDNHPARMGSFHQVVQYDSRIFSGIFYHAVQTWLRPVYECSYRVMCRLLQLHINPFIPGYDIITWINTYG